MNKAQLSLVIIVLILATSLSVSAQLQDFQLVASNEYLHLYLNPTTTEVAIEDIASQKLWFTNPPDRRSGASGLTLQRLNSQFTIVHDPEGVQKQNARFSVAYEQFEFTDLPNGIRCDYTIVEEWKPEHYVPLMIKQAHMEELILSAIEKQRDKDDLLDVYNLIMLAPLGEQTRLELPGLNQDKVFGDYDVAILNPDYLERRAQVKQMQQEVAALSGANTDETSKAIADLNSDITRLERQLNREKETIVWRLVETIVAQRLDIASLDALTHGDVEHLINSPTYLMEQVPRFILGDIQDIVVETGYTPIEASQEHIDNNIDPMLPNLQIFSVPVEYTLDGPNLVVRIPADEIVYPIDVEDRVGEKYTYPLLRISVLEYFGAARAGQEGYIFVPDGSGALINLDNARLTANAYNKPVYGRDNALDSLKELRTYPETIRLPVFGIKQSDQALFAIIEEGASLASIRADISGRVDSYNRVFSEFTTMPSGEVSYDLGDVVGDGRIPVYQARLYQGDFVIRYAFLTGDDATYVGMAHCYQDYLINKYQLTPVPSKADIPFYLEVIGAIDKRTPVIGIARNVIHPLTTFSQVQDMVQDFSDIGIANMQLKYSGWLKGGVNHDYPTKAKLESALGSSADFRSLVSFLDEQEYQLYPSVGLLNVYRDGIFNGFSARNDGARMLNHLPARVYSYHLDIFDMNRQQSNVVISPRRIADLVDSFLNDYTKFGINNLSLFDMASQVSSDFLEDSDKVVDREQSLRIIAAQLEKIHAQGYRIMVDSGNAYALGYADSIVNLPMSSSQLAITDSDVPFYQIVVHGLIDYAGEPINHLSSPRVALLKMLETGAYPYFIASYAPSFAVKNTAFEHLYALYYGDWIDLAADAYKQANLVLHDVQDQKIIDHKTLAPNVYQTTYGTGKSVIVNYNKNAVTIDGYTIAAEDFVVLEGNR